MLPFDYYHENLKMCEPENGKQAQSESLGSILLGDRLYTSPFELEMNKPTKCKKLCTSKYEEKDATFLRDRIKEDYYLQWVVDNLPASSIVRNQNNEEQMVMGIGLGEVDEENGGPAVFNHWEITVSVHTEDYKAFRVVGIMVEPHSLPELNGEDCLKSVSLSAKDRKWIDGKATEITWSYSVKYVQSSTPWATRWDTYLRVSDPKIHWFSIVNSVVIVLFLTGMVGMVLLRALHKDIARYNALEVQEDAQEDFGWKLVHGDVFRPPVHRMFLAVAVGNGAQLFLMASVTLVFAVLGFLSPSSRGSLSTVMLVFYVCFGSVAGYTSARLYKMFNGEKWRRNVFLTAFLLPGIVFIVFVILNFFLIGAKSSAAVPFGTMFALIAMWCLISVPLCFIGAYFGFKKPRIEHPVRTNQIPRQIPEQPGYLRKLPSILMGGILPFGAIFIELYFIFNSIWFHRIYYVFGFLFLVFVILIVTCSEITILLLYFHLCTEDYHWWWRSFFTGGAPALYMFLYSISYYSKYLSSFDGPSTFLYFGWTFIMSLLFMMLTGTIGFVASFLFVRKIYSSIKID
ncbi:hypothetical protein HDV00_005522 [Rhizophlyctis rosea]|nr:hypothetical protein HDV00_005522 [Rhizophlyctis rosea]